MCRPTVAVTSSRSSTARSLTGLRASGVYDVSAPERSHAPNRRRADTARREISGSEVQQLRGCKCALRLSVDHDRFMPAITIAEPMPQRTITGFDDRFEVEAETSLN
jgi:hypothetical protein